MGTQNSGSALPQLLCESKGMDYGRDEEGFGKVKFGCCVIPVQSVLLGIWRTKTGSRDTDPSGVQGFYYFLVKPKEG